MLYKIPDPSTLVDTQFFQVSGPNGILSGFQYDNETRSMYIKESQVIIPSSHGHTHVADDPVPEATANLHGLMSSDDKARLDALLQMRLGVLGFQGAGYPDDGGWLEGDIILASGSELLSIERIGNVVRFSIDTPVRFDCGCEECAQIYWIQDETDVSAIRAPSCAGKMPGTNSYGELKVYLLPENMIVDPNNPAAVLNRKNEYPAMIFKRYENSTTYGAQFEMVLRRNTNFTTRIGMSMTPGAGTSKVAELVYFTGIDDNGETIRFDFHSESVPGMLGMLLYNGKSLTRRNAIITGYDSTILSTNQYKVKYWDDVNHESIGNEFIATNICKYAEYDTDTPRLIVDAYSQVLELGTVVELWETGVGTTARRRFFNRDPGLNINSVWSLGGTIKFGDTLTARTEKEGGNITGHESVGDIRTHDRTQWGITGFEDPFYSYDNDPVLSGAGTLHGPYNNLFVAREDYSLPGLYIDEFDASGLEGSYERPIYVWHRGNHKNLYAKMLVGRPNSSLYPPIDIILRSPIDNFDDRIFRVTAHGMHGGNNYAAIEGIEWDEIPQSGAIGFLSSPIDAIWHYDRKALGNEGRIILLGTESLPSSFDDPTICRLLHLDYNTACLRLQFSINNTVGAEVVQHQFVGGQLDMAEEYEYNGTGIADDLVRGFTPGYAVSRWYTQNGFTDDGSGVTSDPEQYRCLNGGFLTGGGEAWNTLELMYRNDQLWVWWNSLLVTPDPYESSTLPTPVGVNTPYFVMSSMPSSGKFGLRLWPGAKIREVEVRDMAIRYNELYYGQLEIEG